MSGESVALTINAGSSSIRFATWSIEGAAPRLRHREHRHKDEATPQELLALALAGAEKRDVAFVAHRVVHGGRLARPSRVDAAVEKEIGHASALAPLHNPVSLAWIHAARAFFGDGTPEIAVFDTAFFSELPAVAATYALPRELIARLGLRRYGFHGLAHESLWRAFSGRRPERAATARVISLQLGSGCSACAMVGGKPVDTSMGLTPLEGLVMGTRSGDVDPGLLVYLQRVEGLDASALERLLEERSGLLGLSGRSADMQVLLEADDADAKLAASVWCYRVRKYIGAFAAVLGGVDAVLLGGGIGENSPEIRSRLLRGMEWCGIELDDAANRRAKGAERLDTGRRSVEAWVFPVDEEALLAEHALSAFKT